MFTKQSRKITEKFIKEKRYSNCICWQIRALKYGGDIKIFSEQEGAIDDKLAIWRNVGGARAPLPPTTLFSGVWRCKRCGSWARPGREVPKRKRPKEARSLFSVCSTSRALLRLVDSVDALPNSFLKDMIPETLWQQDIIESDRSVHLARCSFQNSNPPACTRGSFRCFLTQGRVGFPAIIFP
ncbi:hypothetical protein CEXT_210971 [Caerostris extrusa]|uniref:Uncharacterized protein n=1 Tax=Caerostris extrusa TaxID=172846 RepID=A0AAV4M6V7_CAEEX|nr:hypothetical protein CEXT_210971 [Caerostris extrusa]